MHLLVPRLFYPIYMPWRERKPLNLAPLHKQSTRPKLVVINQVPPCAGQTQLDQHVQMGVGINPTEMQVLEDYSETKEVNGFSGTMERPRVSLAWKQKYLGNLQRIDYIILEKGMTGQSPTERADQGCSYYSEQNKLITAPHISEGQSMCGPLSKRWSRTKRQRTWWFQWKNRSQIENSGSARECLNFKANH